MNERNDYLWDGSGPADPEVRDLEGLLGGRRYRGRAPQTRTWDSFPVRVAALVLVGIAVVWAGARLLAPAPAGWKVECLAGTPRDDVLHLGEWLETRGDDRVRIEVADIGHVEVEPRSRLRLVSSDEREHRLELQRGTLHAQVLAPPRLFVVDTPAVRAVDLGCAYTLSVEDDGGGLLQVKSGYVELEAGAMLRSYVPRGASCRFQPGAGPGLPSFDDAAPTLRDLDPADDPALATALAAARPRDTLTLWHLLQRVRGTPRQQVFERLRKLVALPANVNASAILALDRDALLRWRDDLEMHW